ncbi:unnamed protein product, partial [Cyprideis torosa]
LLQTLIREIQDTDHSGRSEEAVKAARRFIGSVARVYVTLLGEAAQKKGYSVEMKVCGVGPFRNGNCWSVPGGAALARVFLVLLPYAIQELTRTAGALINPVRLGVAKPTTPFNLVVNQSDALQVCLFISEFCRLFSVGGRRDVLRRARRVVCCDLFLCWRRRSTTHRLPIGGDGGQQAQETAGALDVAAAGMETPQKVRTG